MKPAPHTVIALRLPKSVPAIGTFAKHLVQSIAANPYFPTPTPPLATVTADIAGVDAAETTAKGRAKGAVEARDVKLAALVTDIHTLAGYVQSVADARPTEAAAIIASAGFTVRARGAHPKPPLAAVMAPAGIVSLRARAAGKRAAYEWQMSSDSGKTWTSLPVTTVARTTVLGLAIGTTVEFRFRSTVGNVLSDWSQAVSLLIH